ncbi:T9SS type A sorting domain-containing protein [Fibrobacter succinogenes]|uniref:Por secretion system C-terminal sorting domain-containing protein n=1 Tax=Fibrobacter succinogenes TaxID=833 RepID=A0A380RU97_FIBSU|nr:T9SS type A sorting domain-containing protein [Fibrobacter succinogenes]PWJ36871.1 putative secreted protein (Por secretion system target) [Fibrobacter succinogenes subsp. elongatus]SUQ19120.1 Por secretion system C-terminal sorting domain-containing protein [Fibrobacter succinogenes]
MKKFLLTALCAATSTFAGPFITWNGADESVTSQVETGLRNETDISGYWVAYSDDSEGAESQILWDIDLNPEWIPNKYDPIIDYCKGMCGTAHLRKATSSHVPSANVAFCVVGMISEHDFSLVTGDASSWGGLCVTYTSDTDISLELGLGEVTDSTINYANPAVPLPASKTSNRMVFSWSDFKQPSSYNGDVKIDGETAAKQLATVRFKIQAEDGDYRFNICAVGPKDGTCPEQCGTPSTGIQIARGTSAVKAILNGRTLGFTGIKSTATAEVMNSLGQVVMKGAINNATNNATTISLASLNAGIYMVRVSGKNVNFAKKIVLR